MQNCQGFCRQSIVGGQAQMANQGYINIHNQQMAMSPPPSLEEKFMQLIDGKSDEEIVLAFEILMSDDKNRITEQVRQMQENFAAAQKAQRDNFLSMCQRFRPTINENLLERVGKLKAFW